MINWMLLRVTFIIFELVTNETLLSIMMTLLSIARWLIVDTLSVCVALLRRLYLDVCR